MERMEKMMAENDFSMNIDEKKDAFRPVEINQIILVLSISFSGALLSILILAGEIINHKKKKKLNLYLPKLGSSYFRIKVKITCLWNWIFNSNDETQTVRQ